MNAQMPQGGVATVNGPMVVKPHVQPAVVFQHGNQPQVQRVVTVPHASPQTQVAMQPTVIPQPQVTVFSQHGVPIQAQAQAVVSSQPQVAIVNHHGAMVQAPAQHVVSQQPQMAVVNHHSAMAQAPAQHVVSQQPQVTIVNQHGVMVHSHVQPSASPLRQVTLVNQNGLPIQTQVQPVLQFQHAPNLSSGTVAVQSVSQGVFVNPQAVHLQPHPQLSPQFQPQMIPNVGTQQQLASAPPQQVPHPATHMQSEGLASTPAPSHGI